MIILLDNNEVWWTGMRLEYRPKLMKLPYSSMGKIKIIAAGQRTLSVVDEFNQIYMMYEYLPSAKQDIKTGINIASSQIFGGGNILKLGGQYQNRYAIVSQWSILLNIWLNKKKIRHNV